MKYTETIDTSKLKNGMIVTVASKSADFCGDWKLYQCQSWMIKGLWVAIDENENSLFTVCGSTGTPAEHIENVELPMDAGEQITAAAPELFAALKDAMEYIDSIDTEPMMDNDKRNAALEAIAKATK